jgi:hypothetical protein
MSGVKISFLNEWIALLTVGQNAFESYVRRVRNVMNNTSFKSEVAIGKLMAKFEDLFPARLPTFSTDAKP